MQGQKCFVRACKSAKLGTFVDTERLAMNVSKTDMGMAEPEKIRQFGPASHNISMPLARLGVAAAN